MNIEENPILSEEPEYGQDDYESQEVIQNKIIEEFIIEYRRRPLPEDNFRKLQLTSLNQITSKQFMELVLEYDIKQL